MWNHTRLASWVASFLLGQTSLASAEWRCDCMTIVDSCEATVVVRTDAIEITTDRPQCSRVDYFIDGLPFVVVAIDGRARQDWLAPSSAPRTVVQSCQVCFDRAAAGLAMPAVAPAVASSPHALEPLIELAPLYPPAAQTRGLEGHVDLEFLVTADGSVSEPSVVAAEPAGLFDAAALDAVRRWRYPAQTGRDPMRIQRRLEFSLADNRRQLADAAGTDAAAAPPPDAPLNQCVREGAVYNYGDTVEIDLLNACGEPVLVYGCAPGTGADFERWACQDSDAARAVLVARDDARSSGQVIIASPQGAQSYVYTDGFTLLRAPNTQAWWIACHAEDAACLSRARQWVRALHGQLSSVDPRARTELWVARSH
jgi:TonB family protein